MKKIINIQVLYSDYMTNQYILRIGKKPLTLLRLKTEQNAITIITNSRASVWKENRLILPPDISMVFTGDKLIYWSGRLIKEGFTEVKLAKGKPYEHIFQIMDGKVTVKITSKDQKTFYVMV